MDPSSYSRAALQKLAKENGVRANGTSVLIISELTKLGVFTNSKSVRILHVGIDGFVVDKQYCNNFHRLLCATRRIYLTREKLDETAKRERENRAKAE